MSGGKNKFGKKEKGASISSRLEKKEEGCCGSLPHKKEGPSQKKERRFTPQVSSLIGGGEGKRKEKWITLFSTII